MSVSAVVLAKNEEKNIVDCIESISWCDEIIVIDNDSIDRTRDLSQKMGAKVFGYSQHGDFSKIRNFGLEKAEGEWVLFVDADERAIPRLGHEIANAIKNERVNGYFLKRVDSMWGRQLRHGEAGSIRILRLGRKGKGQWIGKVHETWEILGQTGNLVHPLLHYPHQSIDEFLRELNYYTDIRAKELYEKKTRVGFTDILFYPTGKFFVNYFLKQGFLDGTPGLVFAIFMSIHSFLTRGKLWLLWHKK